MLDIKQQAEDVFYLPEAEDTNYLRKTEDVKFYSKKMGS